jgi:hypothetical protein
MAKNGNSFEQLIHPPLGCSRLPHRPEPRGHAVRQNSRQCLHQQVAGGYVNQRDRFHTYNDGHHFFSSFRGPKFQKIAGISTPVL